MASELMEIFALPSPYADMFFLAVIGLSSLYFALFRPEKILYIFPVALGITAFYVTVGTKWNGEKIVPLIFGVFFLVYISHASLPAVVKPVYRFVVYLSAVISFATIFGSFYLPQIPIGTTFFQGPGVRAIIRGISYEVSLIYFFIPAVYLRKVKDPFSILRCYVYVGLVLSFYGMYQFIAYKVGLPYRAIKFFEDKFAYGALETLGGAFRANGLANEPKQMSMYCLSALVCAVLLARSGFVDKKLYIVFSLLCLIGFVLPLSGSGFFSLLLLLIATVVVFRHHPHFKKYIFITLISACIVSIFIFSFNKGDVLISYAKSLTIERVVGLENYVRMDEYLVRLFVESPANIISGFGIGNYPFWVYDKYLVGVDQSRGIQSVSSAWLSILADLGIFGFLVVVIFMLRIFIFNKYIDPENFHLRSFHGRQISFFCVLASACMMVFVQSFNLFLFWSGIYYGFCAITRDNEA